jgi:hypothetical protein
MSRDGTCTGSESRSSGQQASGRKGAKESGLY